MNHQKLIVGSIVGGLIGAIAALLYIPKTGSKIRRSIARVRPLTLHFKDYLMEKSFPKKKRGIRESLRLKSFFAPKKKKAHR